MGNLRIETTTMSGFTYRNWIISNDAGDVVIFDQDVKVCSRVLGLSPAQFIEEYMNGAASAPDMNTMEANILYAVEKRLDDLDLDINNLKLY